MLLSALQECILFQHLLLLLSRIPFYATTFQLFYGAEATIHDELGKMCLDLSNITGELYEETSKGTYETKRYSSAG